MKKNSPLASAALAALLLCGPALALRVPQGASRAELTLPDGFTVQTELALTPEAQSKGLMFRDELPRDRGMLFVFAGMEVRSFWMKNTFIELDMVFLDADLKVTRVFHRVPRSRPGQPESEVARVSAPAACVLELPSGSARAHRVKRGSKIKISFNRKERKVNAKDAKKI
ncbi:MAG: DUF192 domain-containing protein [Elusimicrobiota bacterium]|nr:DUF192 domain-containing protein [Elusimicrobiota bacterium]